MSLLVATTIPAKHSAHTLLGTIRWLREDPVHRRVRPRLYAAEPMDLEAFMAWFRRSLEAKINRNEPRRGRKDDSDWQRAVYHTARKVNTPRLIVREPEVVPEYRDRLRHRIFRED